MPEGVGGGRIQQGNPSDYSEDLRPFKEKGRGWGQETGHGLQQEEQWTMLQIW